MADIEAIKTISHSYALRYIALKRHRASLMINYKLKNAQIPS